MVYHPCHTLYPHSVNAFQVKVVQIFQDVNHFLKIHKLILDSPYLITYSLYTMVTVYGDLHDCADWYFGEIC